jgi:hypothetical protein
MITSNYFWREDLEKKPEAIAGGIFLVFRSGAIVFYRRKADITPFKGQTKSFA